MNIAFMIRHTPEVTYRACQNILIPKLAKSRRMRLVYKYEKGARIRRTPVLCPNVPQAVTRRGVEGVTHPLYGWLV